MNEYFISDCSLVISPLFFFSPPLSIPLPRPSLRPLSPLYAAAQYIPLSVGLTALVIVLAIIGAGLGAICCVVSCCWCVCVCVCVCVHYVPVMSINSLQRKCWLCKKTVKVYPKITHYAPLTVDEKKLVDTTPHETMLH